MHAWYVTIVRIAAVARAFLGSCAPAGSAPSSWKCMMVLGTCGFQLYRSHIVFGRGCTRLHECMRSCCRQSHRIVPAAVPLFDEYHTNSEYLSNIEYLSNMRGHVEIIQVHNIMAVETDGNTGERHIVP